MVKETLCDVCQRHAARYKAITDFNRPTIWDTVEAIRKNLLRPDMLCPTCLYAWHTEVRPEYGWSAIVLAKVT